MPRPKNPNRDLAYDAGLLTLKRIPKLTPGNRSLLTLHLLDLAATAGRLTKKDLEILAAVRQYGSISAAAMILAPGRPAYRTYIQRRFKFYGELGARSFRKISALSRLSDQP